LEIYEAMPRRLTEDGKLLWRPRREANGTTFVTFGVSRRRRSSGEQGVQFGERLGPTLLAGGHVVLAEPLADFESRPSVDLVVELDSHPRLERLEAPRQIASGAHDAIEQLAVDDVGEVDAAVSPSAGFVWKDLRPTQVSAGAQVDLDLVAGQYVADRTPPRREVVRVRERLVDARAWCVDDARQGELWGCRGDGLTLLVGVRDSVSVSAGCTEVSRARWSSSRSNLSAQSRSCCESQVAALASDVGESCALRHRPCWLRVMIEARSSTLRCREIAGRLME